MSPSDNTQSAPLKSSRVNFWEGWKKFNHALGNFIAKVQLTLLYFTILVPFGIWTRLWMDPLDLRARPAETYWHPHSSTHPKTISSGRE